MNVDIIIPIYNQFERLRFVLEGFSRQKTNHAIRIIVVDDGSVSLPGYAIDSACKYDIEYIHLEANKGRSFARNIGLQYSKGDIVIFNDADRIPDVFFVENHVNTIENSSVISIGSPYEIYVSNIENSQERIWEIVEGKNKKGRLYPYAKKVDSLYGKNEISEHPLIWLTTYSGNIALCRETCLKFLFDENLKKWGLENLEWGLRMHEKGLKFHRTYQCVNYHLAHRREKNFYEDGLKENYNYLLVKYNYMSKVKPLYDFIKGKITLAEYEALI